MPTPDEWIKTVKEAIKALKNLEADDRLENVDALLRCVASIQSSNKGWISWLASPAVMKNFTKNELHEMLETFKVFAVQYLEFDLKWTAVLNEKNKKKKQEHNSKKKGKKKTTYIS